MNKKFIKIILIFWDYRRHRKCT